MAELTQNEKRLLAVLEKEKKADAPHLAGLLDATPEAVVQWAHLAQDKGLVTVERIVAKEFVYTDEGKEYAKERPSRDAAPPIHPAGYAACRSPEARGIQDRVWPAPEERARESRGDLGYKDRRVPQPMRTKPP